MNEQTKLEILCAYLPYGVECLIDGTITAQMHSVYSDGTCTFHDIVESEQGFKSVQPILRHPDDMTEEELGQLGRILWGDATHRKELAINDAKSWLRGTMKPTMSQKTAQKTTMYLHSIHIDTFGSIEAGWAIRK
jgi:hypothetical protein